MGAPRNPAVVALVRKHGAILSKSIAAIKEVVVPALLDAQVPPWPAKQRQPQVSAKETTLVDAQLPMVEAVAECLKQGFPVVSTGIDLVAKSVIGYVAANLHGIQGARAAAMEVLRRQSEVLQPLTRDLRALVPEFARPIAANVNFGLIEALVQAMEWVHQSLVDSLCLGFQVLGDIPFCGSHRPVEERPVVMPTKRENAESFDHAVKVLSNRARKERGDAKALQDQKDIWEASVAESQTGKNFCEGPLTRAEVERMFRHVPGGARCIPAFGIWQNGKLRRIDDAKTSLHNFFTRMYETIVCVTAEWPARAAAEFVECLRGASVALKIGTDDIASAYRILVSGQPQYTIAAVWKPVLFDGDVAGVRYFVLRGFNFGLKCAPLHLATLMDPLVDWARKVLLVPCAKFYDDVAVVDPVAGGGSAQRYLGEFFALLGYPFAEAKHEKAKGSNAFLGVVTDFSTISAGYVLLRIKEKRRLNLIAELQRVREARSLTPAHAARLRGKLYFSTSSAFFGVGRAALRAFTDRQYDRRHRRDEWPLDESLESAIDFFLELLQDMPPQKFYIGDDGVRPWYVWTDAMYEAERTSDGGFVEVLDEVTGEMFYIGEACIAFTAYCTATDTWYTSSAKVGLDVIRKMVPGKKTYIGQLEALAAACFLESVPAKKLKGQKAIMWIDNLAAKYGLQKGSSRADDSARIIHAFKVRQAALQLRVWFEYVPSEQNVADLPSRGHFEQMREVLEKATGGPLRELVELEMRYPDFSSWGAPMQFQPFRRKRARHGSRGAGRKKR